MSEKFIVIGDIHGCLDQLNEILDQTAHFKDHKYIFLGDYLDRGPDAEGVIKRIRELDAVFLMGNHEEMFIKLVLDNIPEYKSFAIRRSGLSDDSIAWLSTALIDHYETENYFFVHAGLNKRKSLEENTPSDFFWIRESGDYYDMTDKTVIHGHTSVDQPEVKGNRININTGSGSGGCLTALVIPEFEYISSSKTPGEMNILQQMKEELEQKLEEWKLLGQEIHKVNRKTEEDFGELEEV